MKFGRAACSLWNANLAFESTSWRYKKLTPARYLYHFSLEKSKNFQLFFFELKNLTIYLTLLSYFCANAQGVSISVN